MKVKTILIALVGLVVLVVGGSVVATEAQNHQAKNDLPAPGAQVSEQEGDAVLARVYEQHARDMEAKRGQPLAAVLRYGMTLPEVQRLLGAGHGPYSADGPIRSDEPEFKARFPAPGDARSDVLVAFVHGGAYAAQILPKGEDSFKAGLPGGTPR